MDKSGANYAGLATMIEICQVKYLNNIKNMFDVLIIGEKYFPSFCKWLYCRNNRTIYKGNSNVSGYSLNIELLFLIHYPNLITGCTKYYKVSKRLSNTTQT
jgi:hypothetical protein